MIVTEIYKGQGLGNQLACYITTRVIALDKGYDFGIQSPEKFKGADFLDLDFGKKVIGGNGPEGGPPTSLPDGIVHYYNEQRLFHPSSANITIYDKNLVNVSDNTKIDGLMQDEQYIAHRKSEIREWLQVKEEYDCFDYADENTCIINFRGGEYARHPEFFLTKTYWKNAVAHMLAVNPLFRFIVITDDVFTAKKFFPHYSVFHFSIGKDFSIIKNAHYLILSNSSFAWFPAWLNENLKFCIAPKYWARHNISDGYWSLGYNITSGWNYLDREGQLHQYIDCLEKFNQYLNTHKELLTRTPPKIENSFVQGNILDFFKKNTPALIKTIAKMGINESKYIINYIIQPIDLLIQRQRDRTWLSKIELDTYRKNIKIYDAFNFFNELETLEIRLNILNEHIDYFVLVESTLTHSGKPKELFYENNKSLFKKFEHKILHFIINDPLESFEDAESRLANPLLPESDKFIVREALSSDNIQPGQASFLRDFYEKEYVKKALMSLDLSDDDFCYVSDLDEIWNPNAFVDYSKDDIYKLKQDPYMYYLNNRSNEDWGGWTGTIATKYRNIKNNCLNHLRTKSKTKYTVIKDGGWHFSFQGGAERIKKKIESYSHQEINNDTIKGKIVSKITSNNDIRGKGLRFWIDESKLPQYILENKRKYKELFK